MAGWKEINIFSLRNGLGLSQAEMGRRLGVDQASVSRWERGVQQPDAKARARLSEFLFLQDGARRLRPEIAMVAYSPFPMSIVARDWTIVALSEVLMSKQEEFRRGLIRVAERAQTTAELEQAIAIL